MKNLERKKDIRERLLALRKMQSPAQWRQKTDTIINTIITHQWFREAEFIFCYMDVHGEVGMRTLISESWKERKRVCIPLVIGNSMDFYEISSFSELKPGRFGILEPSGDSTKISGGGGLMILPGVAFDRERNRIGYGGGYYDRYLTAHPGLHTMGAAFDFQIVETMECEKTDVKPEIVVTETKKIGTGGRQDGFAKGSGNVVKCCEHKDPG